MNGKQFSMLIVVTLVAVLFQSGCTNTDAPPEINVMSFNIRYGTAQDGDNHWDNRREMVFHIIRQHSPDVIGIQEALRFQLDEIGAEFPEYSELGIGRDGGTEGEYSAILFRRDRFELGASGTFWLSDTPEVPSITWGNACVRICTWGRFIDEPSGSAFYLYNTHLDHQSQPSREKSVRLISEMIQSRSHRDPIILTGDFNAGEDNPAIEYLKSEREVKGATCVPLIDTYREINPDETNVGTFNGFVGSTDRGKIDYIFVGEGSKTLQALIDRTMPGGRCPSDHFPVTARLRLR
jgi:endonuclease/exonuclease/phosphatase family metal-dependent hydrolase